MYSFTTTDSLVNLHSKKAEVSESLQQKTPPVKPKKQLPVEDAASWLIAILAGTIINILLFTTLGGLGEKPPPLPTPSPTKLTIGFAQEKVQPAPVVPQAVEKMQPPVQQPEKQEKNLPETQPKPKQRPVERQPRIAPPEAKQLEQVKQEETKPVTADSKPKQEQQEVFSKPVPFYKLTGVPRFIHEEKPVYPASLLKQGREATVKLEIYIDINGQVRDIKLLKSAGKDFDQAAIKAIRASTFAPGSIKGKPVPTLMRLPVKFTLR